MENKTTQYITKYNDIENLLNKIPNAPIDANMKWLEDNISDLKIKNKLYLCRVIRNYIQHNSDGKEFISINDNNLSFLDEMKTFVLNKIQKAEDIMVPSKKLISATTDSKVVDVIKIMNSKNYGFIPIFDKNEVYITCFTKEDALILFEQDKIKKTTKFSNLDIKKDFNKNKVLVKFSSKDKLIEEVSEILNQNNLKSTKLLITDNGKSTGKVIGLLTKSMVL